jgi:hypothetical protein
MPRPQKDQVMAAAVVDQVVDSTTDRTHGLSSMANNIMVLDSNKGLPYGPYHPESAANQRR